MARLNFYCEVCDDPDESCQFDGVWQGIASFYCPDCGTEYEIDHEQFNADGDYIGGKMPEKDPRYELRGRHGNYAVFDTKHAIPMSWHSLKEVAEKRVDKLNERNNND